MGGRTATGQTASEMTDHGMQEQAPSGDGEPRDASATAGAGPSPGAGSPLGVRDERGIAAGVHDVVRTAMTSVGRAGNASRVAIGEAFEGPGRALAGRIAVAALSQPRPVADPDDLAAALNEQPRAPLLGGATGAALAAKVARRVGPLRFLARRTPMWLVITAVPALQASVARGAEELALVASHLVHRARAAGMEPDSERVRRAAVQLVSGSPVDPATEPRHAPLVVAWLERALRATLPFSPGVATRNPGSLARAATAVDPSTLRGVTPLLSGEDV